MPSSCRNLQSAICNLQSFPERVAESLQSLGVMGRRIVVAVSGGPDSTALLLAINSLSAQGKLDLAAVHANHALRGDESDADEAFVKGLCKRLEVPLVCRRLEVPTRADDRAEGIEATARRLRQEFFASAARDLAANFVATAHTSDDQAETVLHRIVRGTGLAGLAGIPASRMLVPGVKLIRPLLCCSRDEVLQFLAVTGQDFRQDRSNLDLVFTRNRVRHELLPYLSQHFNPQVKAALVRLASQAADAQGVIERQVQRLWRRAVLQQNDQRAVLNIAPLRRAPRFLVCELIRQLWTDQTWPLQEIGRAELERVAELVTGNASATDLPNRVRAQRTRGRLILQRL